MKAIKRYRRYRRVGMELNHKIIDALVDSEVIEIAARALGLGGNRQLVLDSEDDLAVLMDFALYEIRRGGKSLVERYRQQYGGANHVERLLLDAMVRAQTGLFVVEGVEPSKYLIRLRGLVGEREEVGLTDINFSQTLRGDVILFFRPVRVEEFTMTSGCVFAFWGRFEPKLLETWRKAKDPADRFVRFFKLSRKKGIPTLFV